MEKVNKQTNGDSSPKPSTSENYLRKTVAANDLREVPHSPGETLNISNTDTSLTRPSMNQNTEFPRDKTDEGREDECCQDDSSNSKLYQNDCHLIIETDSDSSLSKAEKNSINSSGEFFSSTPNTNSGIKKTITKLRRHHRRKGKRLLKKSRIPFQKHGTANKMLSLKTQTEQKEDSDSEWESLSDMEPVSEGQEEQTQETVRDASDIEGPLLVDTDGSGEELDGSQLPLNDQLEKTIADGSARNNLSVSNVKSIIWTLLSHDLVKELLKTKLKAVDEDEDDGDVFEPKLTRSKMKEVLEKGSDGKGWPLSPVKLGQSSTAGPSILDVEFSEDEDEEDDEYQPSKDAADLESDDDSIVSSNVSDIGSPFPFSSPLSKTPSSSFPFTPSTPSTPPTPTAAGPSSSTHLTSPRTPSKDGTESEKAAHIMGPPVGLPPSSHSSTRQRLVFKSPEKQSREAEDDGIAGRTRSKLPLTTTSLYDIEEAFVAPDITPDMYDTMCDDSDWQEFLKSLHKLEGPAEAGDPHNESVEQGEDDDPEFNYSAEAEEIDLEEARFDGPFRVSRKELNSLLEELGDLFNEDDYSMIGLRTNLASAHHNAALLAKKPDGFAQQEALQIPVYSRSSGSVGKDLGREAGPSAAEEAAAEGSQPMLVSVLSPVITDQQVRMVEEHMRKHVQLLTQMYVLAQGSDDFHPMADTCRKLGNELEQFGRVSVAGSKSVFHACNIAGAVEIMNRDVDWPSLRQQRTSIQTTERSASQPLASVSSAVDGDLVNPVPEEGCEGESGQKERGEREEEDAVTLEADKSFRARKINLDKSRPPLLAMQKEMVWSSPVFLYPSLLPSHGLAPRDTIQQFSSSACGRTHFCPGEDALLVLGKEQFQKWPRREVFAMVHQYLMPCKDPQRLQVRFFGRKKGKDNCIVRYRQTGEVPKAPETAEVFTPHMVKAPCDQPDSLLPKTWRLHRRKLHLAKQKEAREEQQRKEEEERKRQEEEHRRRKAEKRRRKKLAMMGEEGGRGPQEMDGQSAVILLQDPGNCTGELSTGMQDRRDSTGEPPEKVRRLDTRSEQTAVSETSPPPVTIPPSLPPSSSSSFSAESSTPSTLLTPQGLYVSLDLADLAKLRAVLPTSQVVVVEDCGQQRVVFMEKHLSERSKSIGSDRDVWDVLTSLADPSPRAAGAVAGLQGEGPGEVMDVTQELERENPNCENPENPDCVENPDCENLDCENPDCGGDVRRKETDCSGGHTGSQGPESHQLSFQSGENHGEEMQKECTHPETENPDLLQSGSLGQHCTGSEAGHSTMDVDEAQTGQNCTLEISVEEGRERKRESLEHESEVNQVMNSSHSEQDQHMLSCSREELLCEQQEEKFEGSREESLCGFDDSCEEAGNEPRGPDGRIPHESSQGPVSEQQSVHHSEQHEVNLACDLPVEAQCYTEQISEEGESSVRKSSVCQVKSSQVKSLCSESVGGDRTGDVQNPASNCADTEPDITDRENTAGEVSDLQTGADPQCRVPPQNNENQDRNSSPVEPESHQQQDSRDSSRGRETQQEHSAGTGSPPGPSIHVGLIFHVQARRVHDKLSCMLGLPHAQDGQSLKELDAVEEAMMRKMWCSPKCHWLEKYQAQEDSESIKCSSPEVPLMKKAGIVSVRVVVINMMYRADYSQQQQQQQQQHSAEDTAESPTSTTPDGNSATTGQQGETSHQAETQDAPDNGVSTTSDIGEPGESSTPAASAPLQQSVESSSALSTVCADSSNASGDLPPSPEPRASVLQVAAGGMMAAMSQGMEEEGNCVSSSSPGLQGSGEQQQHNSRPWSGLGFVDSSADSDNARSALSPGVIQEHCPSSSPGVVQEHCPSSSPRVIQEHFPSQNADSVFAAPTSESDLGVGISDSQSVSAGEVGERAQERDEVCAGRSVAHGKDSSVSSWSDVSSSDLTSVFSGDSDAQGEPPQPRDWTENAREASTSSADSQGRRGESAHTGSASHTHTGSASQTHTGSASHTHTGSASHTHTGSASHTHTGSASHTHTGSASHTHTGCSSHTHTGGSGDAAHSHTTDADEEEQDRQRLLHLIESGRSENSQGEASDPSVAPTTTEEEEGSAQSMADDAVSGFRQGGDPSTPGTDVVTTDTEASHGKGHFSLQFVNEQSPLPYTPYLVAELPSAIDAPAEQHSPETSPPSHALRSAVSPENPGTPTMLSCLGLVSTKQTTPPGTPPTTAQKESNPGTHPSPGTSRTIATLTPFSSESPTKSYTLHYTPENSPQKLLRTLVPKPGPLTYPSPPRVPRVGRGSPKKQQLQKQVRAILPKGYSYELKGNSPTKAAARTLKKRATLFCQRSPSKPILPKDPSGVGGQTQTGTQSGSLHPSTTPLLPWNRRGRRARRKKEKPEATTTSSSSETTAKKTPAAHSSSNSSSGRGQEERGQEESDETGSEVEDIALMSQDDSQNEEEGGEAEDDQTYMQDLMAASTTIGFNPYIKAAPDKDGHQGSKQEVRRQQKLTLLASDVVETDPQRDDRDLAQAQLYLNKVKVAMQKDLPSYTQFVDLLRQFETNQASLWSQDPRRHVVAEVCQKVHDAAGGGALDVDVHLAAVGDGQQTPQTAEVEDQEVSQGQEGEVEAGGGGEEGSAGHHRQGQQVGQRAHPHLHRTAVQPQPLGGLVVGMYESVRGVLGPYPDLLEDFAAFLQPGQALHTRCHVPNLLMHHLRAFLRKLELHYGLKGSRLAKILRTVGRWDFKNKSPSRLRELLLPMLGTTVPQHLLDDFVLFFPDIAPPDSHMESGDFEEINLRDSDDDGNRSPDDFEDITFPDENDPYRTRRCPCNCHKASKNKRKKKEKYTTHCYKCCLKVVEGQLYFQPSNVTTRRPVSATFYNPMPMPLPPDLPPPSARSRGAFHHSAILDEVDDDDHDDDMEDDIEMDEDDTHADTEDDKGTEDEKPETEEDDEKPVTEDEEEEEDDEEDFEEEDEEELTEEEESCSPAKQRRMAESREGESSWTAPVTSKEPLSVDPGSQLSPTQRALLRPPDSQQSLSPQPKPPHTADKLSTEQQSGAQRALIQQQQPLGQQGLMQQQPLAQQPRMQQPLAQQPLMQQQPLAQHALTIHPAQQQSSLAQHALPQHPQQSLVSQVLAQHQHAVTKELLSQAPGAGQPGGQRGGGVEEGVQPLTSRRPASPSLPAVTVMPAAAAAAAAAAGLHGKRIRLPKPGESNIRMRKRILSMQPGRQVSLSMQTLAPKQQGLAPKDADASPDLMQASAPTPTLSPLLRPPSGSGSGSGSGTVASWKPPRIVSNKTLGTVSVVGPDNTVIMFNSSLPTPALGETLPGLQPDLRSGLIHALGEPTTPAATEETPPPALPTITSPHKNMERGNFAGLLQGSQSSEVNRPSVSSASLESGSGGDGGTLSSPVLSDSVAPAPPPVLTDSGTLTASTSSDSLMTPYVSSDSVMPSDPASSSAAPLMSEDTLSALFDQMREGQRTGDVPASFDVHSNSSLSSLLSKMMQYPEGQQESADLTKLSASVSSTAPEPVDLSAPSHPPPPSTPALTPVSHQAEASSDSVEWTSEQDRLIVETVRDHGASASTFSHIAAQLEGVTPSQVSERVSRLMEFLDMSEGEEEEDL